MAFRGAVLGSSTHVTWARFLSHLVFNGRGPRVPLADSGVLMETLSRQSHQLLEVSPGFPCGSRGQPEPVRGGVAQPCGGEAWDLGRVLVRLPRAAPCCRRDAPTCP